MTRGQAERLTAAELQQLAGRDDVIHDTALWRFLTPGEDQSCRAQADEQLAAGVHPRDVRVTIGTGWGWIEGLWLGDTAPAVEPVTVAVRIPRPSLLEKALTVVPRRVWDFTSRGISIQALHHFSAWCFLFGICMSTVNPWGGLGWTFGAFLILGLAGELWVRRRTRRALRIVPVSAATRELALLAANPGTTHDQLWQAAGRHPDRRTSR